LEGKASHRTAFNRSQPWENHCFMITVQGAVVSTATHKV
jgi:hypothetical protein